MKITAFKRLCNISIDFGEDCALLGVTHTGHIYVEAYDEIDVRQYYINPTCDVIASGILNLPDNLITPMIPADHVLNHRGGRLRGLLETDRITAWVQPLTIMEKMSLMPQLGLSLPPMSLLGIAESHVLSEAKLSATVSIVCRRLRFAYALPQPKVDEHGLPYDYDTLEKYVIHRYDAEAQDPPSLVDAFAGLDGIPLQRPQDCIVLGNKLIIADNSMPNLPNRILVFEIEQAS